jgi:hypothetical protein
LKKLGCRGYAIEMAKLNVQMEPLAVDVDEMMMI